MEISMNQHTISLGPFDLLEPIGRGSMGIVWEGVHRSVGTRVAIKVIPATGIVDETFNLAFSNEVRAVARLHHPSIIRILDYGITDETLSESSHGEIASGSQYYAMELATGGVLPRPKTPLAWHRMRFLLLEILDALAHAHARDVIHRDIKPNNILLMEEKTRMRIKLTDFGIAKAVGIKELPNGVVAGTPRYMAPEQILHQTRDQGPWTDLYSVGCLAYLFATGRRIFYNTSGAAVLRCQISETPEPVQGIHIPQGFQAWLDRMLEKRVAYRYQYAAEAAWDLINLPDPVQDDPGVSPVSTPSNEALKSVEKGAPYSSINSAINEVCVSGDSNVFHHICTTTPSSELTVDLSDELLNDTSDTVRMNTQDIAVALSVAASRRPVPSLDEHLSTLAEMLKNSRQQSYPEIYHNHALIPAPKTWRRDQFETAPQLVDAGLGLWGLRAIPLIDREDERDAIYNVLLEARHDHNPHTIIIDGVQGIGKSRLVEWMFQRAHELALAHTIKAFHYADHHNSTGVVRAMTFHLACERLPRHEALARIRTFLEEHPLTPEFDDALPLLELMHLQDDPEHPVPTIHFNASNEKFAVLRRFLQRLCQDRATILWLDDFHLSTFSLEFVQYMMNQPRQDDLPLLILCTARNEEIDESSPQYVIWRHLTSNDAIMHITIEPLAQQHQLALIHELLGLDDDLCERVAQRTCGMPLFAIQLIGNWIERGVLVPGPNGFTLKEGTVDKLPDSLHELWLSRLRLILKDNRSLQNAWEQLELAACLGNQFDADEWRIACEMADLGSNSKTLELMLSHRLFEMQYPNIRFVHTLLRESLLRYADENGRSRQHHLICADMLRDYFSDTFEFYHENRAAHLMAAKVWETAIEPLLMAANIRMQRSEFGMAHSLFQQRETALNACKADENSPIRAYGWVNEAHCYLLESKLEPAEALIARSICLGEEIHSYVVLSLAYKEKGLLLKEQNLLNEAIEALLKSIECFENISERRRETYAAAYAEAHSTLGRIYALRHDLQLGRQYIEQAIDIQKRINDQPGIARSYQSIGNMCQHAGLYEEARVNLEYALNIFQQLGYRLDYANSLNDIGEIFRLGYNQYDAAENYYRRAIEIYRELNLSDSCTTIINLVLLLLSKQRYTEAKQIVLSQIPLQEAAKQTTDLNWLYAELLPCCAATFDWPTFSSVVLRLGNSLEESGVVDADILYCTELAVNLCLRFASREQARFCLDIAMRQAQALGDRKAIDRLNRL